MTTRQMGSVLALAAICMAGVAVILFVSARQKPPAPSSQKPILFSQGSMKLASPSFEQNGPIPSQYTCDGSNLQPALLIADAPANAVSLALIVDDPDAPSGDFVHWTVWNIPTSTTLLEEGQHPPGVEGMTGFGRAGWGGPCPPSGTHRYQFKLYALDATLDLDPSAKKSALEAAMQGHILDQALLVGTYARQ